MIELQGFKALTQLNEINSNSNNSVHSVIEMPIEKLGAGKYQPRKSFSKEELLDLSCSIKKQGILQPLIVRAVEKDKYEIIAGERRFRAAKLAGLKQVPVIVRDVEDSVALTFAVIENIQRENLNIMEEARAYARFRDEFSMKHEEIANLVGKSRAAVTNTIRLLNLPTMIQSYVESGELEMGHARCLLGLESEKQQEIVKKVISKSLSVRATEKLANEIKQPLCPKIERFKLDPETKLLVDELGYKLGRKIDIRRTADGGISIQTKFFDEMELREALEKI